MLYNLKGIEREVQELRESRAFLLSELQQMQIQLTNLADHELVSNRGHMLERIGNCIRNVEE